MRDAEVQCAAVVLNLLSDRFTPPAKKEHPKTKSRFERIEPSNGGNRIHSAMLRHPLRGRVNLPRFALFEVRLGRDQRITGEVASLKRRLWFLNPKNSRSALTTLDFPVPPGPLRYIKSCSGFSCKVCLDVISKARICSLFSSIFQPRHELGSLRRMKVHRYVQFLTH